MAGGMIACLLTDGVLGTGGGHVVAIDSHMRRDGSSNAFETSDWHCLGLFCIYNFFPNKKKNHGGHVARQ